MSWLAWTDPTPVSVRARTTTVTKIPTCRCMAILLKRRRDWGRRACRRLLLRARRLDVLADHIVVGAEPVGHLHELPALDLIDLDQPAALVVIRRDLERRHESAQREARDLLEPFLHVLAGDPPVGLGLERVPHRLDLDSRPHDTAVVVDRRRHLLRRRLALLLVHLTDLVQDGVVRPHARELHDVVALGDRKSTRLNSSHGYISYAVFCLKKKKQKTKI